MILKLGIETKSKRTLPVWTAKTTKTALCLANLLVRSQPPQKWTRARVEQMRIIITRRQTIPPRCDRVASQRYTEKVAPSSFEREAQTLLNGPKAPLRRIETDVDVHAVLQKVMELVDR